MRRSKGLGAGSQAAPGRKAAVAVAGHNKGPMSINWRKKLQDKLTSLGFRRKILHNYEHTWAENRESEGTSDARAVRGETDGAKKDTNEAMPDADECPPSRLLDGKWRRHTDMGTQASAFADGDSGKPWRNVREASATGDSISADCGSGPDAILREMNRTGLCRSEELDSRVEAFIIKLKRGGKRAALVSALVKFREHLLRPQSHRRRVRNKSAVLTKLLLSAQEARELRLPEGVHGLEHVREEAWCTELSCDVDLAGTEGEAEAVNGTAALRSAAALRDSVFQVTYPTAVGQRVLRGNRQHHVALRIDKMAHVMFVGVLAKSSMDGREAGAQSLSAVVPSAWWGSPLMTGKVAYVVSNGRCLDGGALVSASRVTFTQGDTIIVRFSPANRSVAFFKRTSATEAHEEEGEGGGGDGPGAADLLIGTVGNVSGRVRVAAQLKSKGDGVSIVPASQGGHVLTELEPPLPESRRTVQRRGEAAGTEPPGAAAAEHAACSAPLNASAPETEDGAYTAPFGGRKVFVGGTRELDSEELQDHLESKFGAVATVKTAQVALPDGTTAPRGFAFVTFLDARNARRAVKAARINYKKGSVFARMEIKACDGALRKRDNEYDSYTAGVLREADERRGQERRAARLAAMTTSERRLLESKTERTPVVALDCEMVGVGSGGRGRRSVLARVCVVNSKGEELYSRFVQPQPQDDVTDYRTRITGLCAGNLTAEAGAVPFEEARGVVAALLHRRVVVGHALRNDFKVLGIQHPVNSIRDTARYRPLRIPPEPTDARQHHGSPSLKSLAERLLGKQIQVCPSPSVCGPGSCFMHDVSDMLRLSCMLVRAACHQ